MELFSTNIKPLDEKIGLIPPPQGTIFHFCDFLPESTYLSHLKKQEIHAAWESMTDGHLSEVKTQFQNAPHPFMH